MSLKVLTVDDSKTIRMIVKKAFRPYDCVMIEAENGAEGYAAAAREKPGLIVLDITMPIMNGVEMLEKLKAEPTLKDIPVIMLTAESGRDNVIKVVKMGVRDYIVKPFKDVQLIEKAKNIVELEPKKTEKDMEEIGKKYFSVDGDIQHMHLPEKVSRTTALEAEGYLNIKIKEMAKSEMSKIIMDLSKVAEVDMNLIKLIISSIENCQKSKIRLRMVGVPTLTDELKGFQETSGITIDPTVEEAKAAL